ncbi:hypothetical protein ABIE50_001587 [Chitinophaga sp. OAE865]
MWKTSTLILIMVFSLFTSIGKAQSDKSQPNTEGGSKIVKLYPNPATTVITFEVQQHNIITIACTILLYIISSEKK